MLAVVDYLANTLKDTDATPLHRQLYRALRAAIQSGQLGNGDPLPASRELARTLGLARNTVLHAYEQLLAEGFLSSRRGAGTFVAYQPPAASTAAHPAAALPPLAQRALAALGETRRRTEPDQGGFVPGRPDLQAFPWSIWWRLLHRRQKAATGNDCDYRSEGGLDALKQQLAQYLALSRGVNCQPKQIVICSGMQGALDLLSRSLADVGELAWVEEPGYSGAKSAWLANGLQLQPISVDGDGLNWEAQPYRSPRLIYVSPAHQYPLGSVMSMPRRLALLELAAQSGAWVVEDDYDSEFRHHGESLAALQGLDRQGRVIYLGTFSKVMFPALRLAYMVLPPALVEPLIALQARLHRESDYLLQGALADFMEQGHFSRHLRRMRSIYAQRQRRLRALLSRLLACDLDNANDPSGFALLGGAAGMHVTLRLPHGLDGEAICAELALRGISVSALSAYCHAAPPFPGLVLGYGGLSDAELPQAVAMLAEVLNAARSKLAASAA